MYNNNFYYDPKKSITWTTDRRYWWPRPAWAGYLQLNNFEKAEGFMSNSRFLNPLNSLIRVS